MGLFPISVSVGETEKLPRLYDIEKAAKNLEAFLAEHEYVLMQIITTQQEQFYIFLKIKFEANIRPEGNIEQIITPCIVTFTVAPNGCAITATGESSRVNGIMAQLASGSILAPEP